MSTPVFVDGMLVDWGTSLFFKTPAKPEKPKKGLTGLSIPRRKPKTGGVVGQGGAKAIRSKLGSIAKRTPEVMVKISGGGKGMKHIKDHLDYISRNGKLELEDQDGETIIGRDGLNKLHDELQCGGIVKLPDEGEKREAFNIVLSMPAGTDELALKRAARDFAAREFENHQYVMALHTYDTDPDPKRPLHPHVHLCVKARSLDGTRLNPKKADLQRWREGFAEALREHGIEAAATNRLQRLERKRGEKKSVEEMKKRGKAPDRVGWSKASPERVKKSRDAEIEVLKSYQQITKALAESDDREDRELALNVTAHLDKQTRHLRRDKSKEQGIDRPKGTER